MELIHARGSTYYFECQSRVGLYAFGQRAAVFDTGNGKPAAKRVLSALEELGLSLAAILNTHSHADHIGGNAHLQAVTGAPVYAPPVECGFVNHPQLEGALIYSAAPPKPLRGRFFLSDPSRALPLTDAVLPEGVSVIPLYGHAADQVGYRTPDDVVFLGDALVSRETLDKYRISYIYDVGAYLDTLRRVKELHAALFVPAHAEATEDILPLADYNIAATMEIGDDILGLLATPHTAEGVLKALFDRYGLTLGFGQFALAGSTVRAYLAWLYDSGLVTAEPCDNYLLFRRV